MQRIEPVIKDYAWGSREALAHLAGRPTAERPQAELWVGAHEAGPATVVSDGAPQTLDAVIADAPEATLGAANGTFAGRLPFLLKILAADKALSIQAHPGAERAASAPEGTYADSWPKPEAWVPLTPSVAFAGQLPFGVAASRLLTLPVPQLRTIVNNAAAQDDQELALISGILAIPQPEQHDFTRDVFDAVAHALKTGVDDSTWRAAWACAIDVERQFPGDIGAVLTLTMNHLVMEPGRSYFIDAGVMHSFVHGVTVEILANSDNVVRAGLTPKKIDVDELLEIVDTSARVEASDPHEHGEVLAYASKVPHFALYEVPGGRRSVELPIGGKPALMLALEAPVTLNAGDTAVTLGRLETAWSAADDAPVHATTEPGARLFVATVNA